MSPEPEYLRHKLYVGKHGQHYKQRSDAEEGDAQYLTVGGHLDVRQSFSVKRKKYYNIHNSESRVRLHKKSRMPHRRSVQKLLNTVKGDYGTCEFLPHSLYLLVILHHPYGKINSYGQISLFLKPSVGVLP